ncbi:MAG: ABC transporter ATP-binding protein [Chloroflexi bacterium]|nr:ABC transporter ATP-binding protein [Chloroflexota bacterium]
MVRLENVAKVYRMGKVDVYALKGVTLSVRQGEMLAIIGASGSGKSTLLQIIGCLDRPTSGEYFFNGTAVSRFNDNRLAEMRNKNLGFVFQQFNLLPRATALANVELPLIYRGAYQRRKLAMEVLERVGLRTRAKHKPTELSGGEQQRVAIARALINRPPLLLADEPTGNLDSVSTGEIVSLFRQLNKEGITIIMVTHEMDIATQCQRIIRLRDGEIASEQMTEYTAYESR